MFAWSLVFLVLCVCVCTGLPLIFHSAPYGDRPDRMDGVSLADLSQDMVEELTALGCG